MDKKPAGSNTRSAAKDQANISKSLAEFSSTTAKLISVVDKLSTKIGKSNSVSAAQGGSDEDNSDIESRIKLSKILLEVEKEKQSIQNQFKKGKASEIDFDNELLKIDKERLRLAREKKKAQADGNAEYEKELDLKSKSLDASKESLTQSFGAIKNAKDLNDVHEKVAKTVEKSNSKLLNAQELLTKQVGMTTKQSANFQDLTASSGKSVKANLLVIQKMTDEYNELTNASISVRDVQKEVASISKTTSDFYKGNVKSITAAVLASKKLEKSTDDVNSISATPQDTKESESKKVQTKKVGKNTDDAMPKAVSGNPKETQSEAQARYAAEWSRYTKEAAQSITDYSKVLEQVAKNHDLVGTENYKNLDISQSLVDIDSLLLDIEKKIVIAKKTGGKFDIDRLQSDKKHLTSTKKQLEVAEEQVAIEAEQSELIEKRLAGIKKYTGYLKEPATIFKDIGKSLEESVDKKFNQSLKNGGGLLNLMGSALQVGLVAGLVAAVDLAFEMNTEIVHLQRNLGVSAKNADKIHTSITNAAQASKILGATEADTLDAFNELKDTFGTNVVNNQKLLDSQILLTKHIGMTNEEAASFQSLSAGTGKSVEENLTVITETVNKYNKMTGDSVAVRDIQKDISKVSKTSLASYKGFGPALVKAVTVAKRLGMSIEDTAVISKSLLDIESSLGAEMEASVLVGRSVNMNAARQLALQGKSVEAAEAALQAVGSYDDFMNMNIIQQEALAKAAGMTVDQIVTAGQEEKKNAIMKRKSFRQLSKEDKAALVAQELLTEKQIEDNIKAEQAADVKERLVAAADKLMKILSPMAHAVILPMVEGLGKTVTFAGEFKNYIKETFPFIVKIKKAITGLMDKIPEGAGTVAKVLAGIIGAGVLLRKVGSLFSGFLSGKAGDSKSKPIWAKIVDGATAVKGAMGRGVDKVKRFGGGVVDKVKSIGGFGKSLLDKFKTFKSTKKEGGWKAGLKSLFTKENLAEMTGGATEVATDAITETPVTDTGIAPLGTEADPIYVKVIGGISGGTATEEAADAGGNPLVDAGLDMFKDSKIGKKFSKMTGGLSDTLLDEVGGGGMGGDSTAAATDAAPMKKDGTPDKRFKANKAPSSSPTPSTPSSGGGGGGFFSGLIDKVKNSKFVSKVGDFAKKLNPLSKLKEWIPKLFSSKGTMSKLLGKLPKIGTIISMASTIYGLGSAAASSESLQDIGSQVLDSIGSMGGSFLAGALGSVVPGAGTILGSMLGGMAGSALAGLISENVDLTGLGKTVVDIFGPKGAEQGEKPVAVADALIRPGMPPITFDKGDMILAGTNLMGGGAEAAPAANNQGSMSEVAGLLKQLITATSQPVKINIGGKVIDEIEKQTTLRKTYNTKVDNVHGSF